MHRKPRNVFPAANRGRRDNFSRPLVHIPEVDRPEELIKLRVSVNKEDILTALAKPATAYDLPDLVRMKNELNQAKSAMDKYYDGHDQDLARKWGTFNTHINTYAELRDVVRKKYNGQFVTNASLKYFELFSAFSLILPDGDSHKTFFNAELPGTALCVYNHVVKTKFRHINSQWRASSLSPDVETAAVLDDRYGLFENNKDRWMMTSQNDGDCTKMSNLTDFRDKLGPSSEFGGVDLYSHDAGIDVSGKDESGQLVYNKQEEMNLLLHLGCALAGFFTMKDGACFIAKQYTFFETLSWNLILIYSVLFDEFYICKPATSRSFNSEIYLIGIGYKHDGKIVDYLQKKVENFDMSPMLALDVCRELFPTQLEKIVEAARAIHDRQRIRINENVSLFERFSMNPSPLYAKLREKNRRASEKWLKEVAIIRLDSIDHLASKKYY